MKKLLLALTLAFASPAYADDYLLPPTLYAPHADSVSPELPQPLNPNELITIDVMILYTPGLAQSLGRDLYYRLSQMVSDANNAYRDSAVNIHLRAIHIQQINYTDHSSNSDALRAMTHGSIPVFQPIAQLRNDAKADLVVLVRSFQYPIQVSCGVAWMLGAYENARNIHKQSHYGYSVVSVGQSAGYVCSELAFTHELGHNMGLNHDKANAPERGAFAYSYGYLFPDGSGTVMAYGYPRIARFSSPIQLCGRELCGMEDTDNARSLNEIRQTIANFRN